MDRIKARVSQRSVVNSPTRPDKPSGSEKGHDPGTFLTTCTKSVWHQKFISSSQVKVDMRTSKAVPGDNLVCVCLEEG